MGLPLLIYAGLVSALVWAEYSRTFGAQVWLKTLCALGFCLIAILSGAFYSTYGQIILLGLLSCALGDVLLLPRNKPFMFKLGMGAFALGHVFYALAFFTQTKHVLTLVISFGLMGLVGWRFWAYVKSYLPADMKIPILTYIGIITVMVVLACATHRPILIVPAIMFAVSDMFVARDRFVISEPRNALAITPLYFGAQALFALGAFGV